MSVEELFEGEPATFKLGMCQVRTEPWDIDGNLARTLTALEEAAAGGAQLTITPECVLHGYGSLKSDEDKKRLHQIAEPVDGPNVTAICEKAKALRMDVIAGFAERDGELLHNTAVFIASGGEVISRYRKVHLRPFEDIRHEGCFTAGTEFFARERVYGEAPVTVGSLICFDREIPESVRCLRALGAQFISCPLACNTVDATNTVNKADNELITRARAAENEVFIAVINHAARFNGGSFVVGPKGQLLHQMGAEPGVHVLEVPIGAVSEKFHRNPLGWMGWGYRRPEVYRPYLDVAAAGAD